MKRESRRHDAFELAEQAERTLLIALGEFGEADDVGEHNGGKLARGGHADEFYRIRLTPRWHRFSRPN